jgi:hypothetical protein
MLAGREIECYDSMSTRVCADTRALCNQLWPGARINAKRTQKQIGAKDCGLFAIANALALATGENLTGLKFDQIKMRAHLVKCLTSKPPKLTMFPLISKNMN